MLHGIQGSFLGGGLIGAVIVANILGFPEVEGAEAVGTVGGGGAILAASTGEPAASIAIGGLSSGALLTPVGATVGYAATKPTCGN